MLLTLVAPLFIKKNMTHMPTRITITGDPGSGKSTFAHAVKGITGFDLITTGNIFRELAAEQGVSITELNQMAEVQKELDAKVDDYLVSLNEDSRNLVLDSRMAWHFVKETFKVRLCVQSDVAVERIYSDTRALEEQFGSLDEARKAVEDRRKSEVKRYHSLYGVDISDNSNFDLVVDTSKRTKEETMALFEEAYANWIQNSLKRSGQAS